MATKILLVLGAGKNVGSSLAHSFKAAGYKVALVSRSGTDAQSPDGHWSFKADLAQPGSIPALFASVKQKLGAAPNVVVYNAAALTAPSDTGNPLTIPVANVEADLVINVTSAYAAAREAVAGFEALPEGLPKSFIYTGNALAAVTSPVPIYFSLGVGKSASSYWIGSADKFFKEKGYRFFFADERLESGAPVGQAISGPAAGDFYVKLAEDNADVPWFATFVSGKGYVEFPESRRT